VKGIRWLGEFNPDVLLGCLERLPFNVSDPGVGSLFTTLDNQGKRTAITLDQWRSWTQTDKFKRKLEKARHISISTDLSLDDEMKSWPTLKVNDITAHKDAVVARLTYWTRLWDVLRAKKIRGISILGKEQATACVRLRCS